MNALTFNAGFAPSRIRLVDIRRRQLLTAQLRMLLLGGGFALVALAALLRVAWLGVVQPAPTEHSMAQALLPSRGAITDRNGTPLARAFPPMPCGTIQTRSATAARRWSSRRRKSPRS